MLKFKVSLVWFLVLTYLVLVLNIFLISLSLDVTTGNWPAGLLKKTQTQPQPPTSLATPTKVKGIYLTGYTFSNSRTRNNLIDLVQNTELNTLVIDIKDPDNRPTFYPTDHQLKKIPVSTVAMDNETYSAILDDLQNKGIYTIARITTFQDNTAAQALPELALKNKSGGIWKNWQGITWLDMTNPAVWDIPVAYTKEAAQLGFDEVQLDYIRFPSDGDIRQIAYYNFPADKKRHQIMSDFFAYLFSHLTDVNIPLSVDLFGLTYQRQNNPEYDLNIGQRLIDAAEYFDFISPMVYPSHYPTGFLGFSNPAEQPYAIVNKAMSEGNLILAQSSSTKALTRPWLQDFDLGANYDAGMVLAQIQASDENNTAGWLLWNASNIYTVEALNPQ